MPQKTTRLPVHVAPTSDLTSEKEKKASDLSVNKVLAGAGAAATAAAVGSFFGAGGTVTGAALGSVVTTVGAVVYQRSLDHTRDKVRSRVRVGDRSVEVKGATQVPAPRMPGPQVPGPRVPPGYAAGGPTRPYGPGTGPPGPTRPYGAGPTVPYPAGPTAPYPAPPAAVYTAPPARPPLSRRRVLVAAAVSVLAFLLGLSTITGIEFVKGSTLATGQEGTSVGRVIESGSSNRGTTDESSDSERTQPESTAEPRTTPTPSATSTPEPRTTATPTPTATAEPDQSDEQQAPQPPGRSGDSSTGSDSTQSATGSN